MDDASLSAGHVTEEVEVAPSDATVEVHVAPSIGDQSEQSAVDADWYLSDGISELDELADDPDSQLRYESQEDIRPDDENAAPSISEAQQEDAAEQQAVRLTIWDRKYSRPRKSLIGDVDKLLHLWQMNSTDLALYFRKQASYGKAAPPKPRAVGVQPSFKRQPSGKRRAASPVKKIRFQTADRRRSLDEPIASKEDPDGLALGTSELPASFECGGPRVSTRQALKPTMTLRDTNCRRVVVGQEPSLAERSLPLRQLINTLAEGFVAHSFNGSFRSVARSVGLACKEALWIHRICSCFRAVRDERLVRMQLNRLSQETLKRQRNWASLDEALRDIQDRISAGERRYQYADYSDVRDRVQGLEGILVDRKQMLKAIDAHSQQLQHYEFCHADELSDDPDEIFKILNISETLVEEYKHLTAELHTQVTTCALDAMSRTLRLGLHGLNGLGTAAMGADALDLLSDAQVRELDAERLEPVPQWLRQVSASWLSTAIGQAAEQTALYVVETELVAQMASASLDTAADLHRESGEEERARQSATPGAANQQRKATEQGMLGAVYREFWRLTSVQCEAAFQEPVQEVRLVIFAMISRVVKRFELAVEEVERQQQCSQPSARPQKPSTRSSHLRHVVAGSLAALSRQSTPAPTVVRGSMTGVSSQAFRTNLRVTLMNSIEETRQLRTAIDKMQAKTSIPKVMQSFLTELRQGVKQRWGNVTRAAEMLAEEGMVDLMELVSSVQEVCSYPHSFADVLQMMEDLGIPIENGCEVKVGDFCRALLENERSADLDSCVDMLEELKEDFEHPLDQEDFKRCNNDPLWSGLMELRSCIKKRWGAIATAANFLSVCGDDSEGDGDGGVRLEILHSSLLTVGYSKSQAELCVLFRSLGVHAAEQSTLTVVEFERLRDMKRWYDAADARVQALAPLMRKLCVRGLFMQSLLGGERLLARLHVAFLHVSSLADEGGELSTNSALFDALQACLDALDRPDQETAQLCECVLSAWGLRLLVDIISDDLPPAARACAARVLEKALRIRGGEDDKQSPSLGSPFGSMVWRRLLSVLDVDVEGKTIRHDSVEMNQYVLIAIFDVFDLLHIPSMVAGPRAAKLGSHVIQCLVRLHESVYDMGRGPDTRSFQQLCAALECLELLELSHTELFDAYGRGSLREVRAVFVAFGGCQLLRDRLAPLRTVLRLSQGELVGATEAELEALNRGERILLRWQEERQRLLARWPLTTSIEAASARQTSKMEGLAKAIQVAHKEGFHTSWDIDLVEAAESSPTGSGASPRGKPAFGTTSGFHDCASTLQDDSWRQEPLRHLTSPSFVDDDLSPRGHQPTDFAHAPRQHATDALQPGCDDETFPEGGVEREVIERVTNRSRQESAARESARARRQAETASSQTPALGVEQNGTSAPPGRAHTSLGHREKTKDVADARACGARAGAQTALGHRRSRGDIDEAKFVSGFLRLPVPLPPPTENASVEGSPIPCMPFDRPLSSATSAGMSVGLGGDSKSTSRASRQRWRGHEEDCDVRELRLSYALGRVSRARKLVPLPQWAHLALPGSEAASPNGDAKSAPAHRMRRAQKPRGPNKGGKTCKVSSSYDNDERKKLHIVTIGEGLPPDTMAESSLGDYSFDTTDFDWPR